MRQEGDFDRTYTGRPTSARHIPAPERLTPRAGLPGDPTGENKKGTLHMVSR